MKCFMGIDAGTSGVKVIIVDDKGTVLGTGHHECNIITPRPGWVEQDPESWWRIRRWWCRRAGDVRGTRGAKSAPFVPRVLPSGCAPCWIKN